jgi:16S rRNA (cytosine1402-N4)-methyltransferase
MDPESGRPAADLVNEESEAEIERILREYGEEPQARRIARAIAEARTKKRIATTAELAGIVAAAIGKKGGKHPATLTFQALRIAVNDELAALLQFLEAAPKWLKPGGRLVVISFHSLEDRIVKQAFHHLSTPLVDRPEWPEPRPNPDFCMRLPRRKPLEPTEEETARNPRARSAKLRVAEKMPHEP